MLKGKNVLIVGVANKHSIAAGIAESMASNGANIALPIKMTGSKITLKN